MRRRTASQLAQEIDIYANSSASKLDSEYIRSKYINRQLQLAVENKPNQIAGDPAILTDCFAQHVAYYRQDYFFELYGPLKDAELTSDIRPMLSDRMIMACYNKKSERETGSGAPPHPCVCMVPRSGGRKAVIVWDLSHIFLLHLDY